MVILWDLRFVVAGHLSHVHYHRVGHRLPLSVLGDSCVGDLPHLYLGLTPYLSSLHGRLARVPCTLIFLLSFPVGFVNV